VGVRSGSVPARNGSELRRCPPELGKRSGTLSCDQFFEAAMHERGFFLNTGNAASLINQSIVEVQRSPHMY
jgi:hypothetical protein